MSVTVKTVFEKAPDEMRNVLCASLVELAKDNPNIVAMDADTLGSSGLKPFRKAYPDRYIDCGIQEANMIGVAAGMSAVGKIPFVHSFGPFVSRRVYDQIFLSVHGRSSPDQNGSVSGSPRGRKTASHRYRLPTEI